MRSDKAAARAVEPIWGLFHRLRERQRNRELDLRFEERRSERRRIARELHDTLLQGLFSASMQLHVAVDQMSEDSPSKPRLSRVLQLIERVIDEGRNVVGGLRMSEISSFDLEQALSRIRDEFALTNGVGFRITVNGQPKALKSAVQEEIYHIWREALINALRHSQATSIEIEAEYLPRRLRVVVRDNGCGIDPEVVRSGREAHWGLPGMRERAESIGARLQVWSRPGGGTEVEVSVPGDVAFDRCQTVFLGNGSSRRPPVTLQEAG